MKLTHLAVSVPFYVHTEVSKAVCIPGDALQGVLNCMTLQRRLTFWMPSKGGLL